MKYSYHFDPELDKLLIKLKKKDFVLHEQVTKKVLQIVEKPELYKTLSYFGGKYKRVHIGPFVLSFTLKGNEVWFLSLKPHDEAYKR